MRSLAYLLAAVLVHGVSVANDAKETTLPRAQGENTPTIFKAELPAVDKPAGKQLSVQNLGPTGEIRQLWQLDRGPVSMGAMDPPFLRPFKDGTYWLLSSNLLYHIGSSAETITVPAGFVTDFASIPQLLWSVGLSPTGQYSLAAILHDFLYWSQNCTRSQADNLFMIAMKESGVPTIQRWFVYQGVEWGGAHPWKENSDSRKAGRVRYFRPSLERTLTVPANPALNPMARHTWSELEPILHRLDPKRDVPYPNSPTYCHFGNSVEIPK